MLRMLAVAVFSFAFIGFTTAEDKKEEKLTGTITCAKCDLKLKGVEKCATVIKVGEKVYFFDEKSHKAHHGETCTEAKAGSVSGTVSKDGDKLIITVSKLEYKK